jgi:hypothetical protein
MTMSNITEREAILLTAALNYDDREGQLSDNYSNLDLSGAQRIIGNKHEADGVIGSLVAKGLMFVDEDDHYDPGDPVIWFTKEGVHAIFDYMEAQEG